MTRPLGLLLPALLATTPAAAQRVTRQDSALVARILLAEDRRDSASTAYAQGMRHANERIRLIARRARARVRDPRFAARDSMPAPAAAPGYPDPAWRLRYRALTTRSACSDLREALSDSVWPVRLRAADLVRPECAGDGAMVRLLRDWSRSGWDRTQRSRGGASWQPMAHALIALARIDPAAARELLARSTTSPVAWLRPYEARAAVILGDTALLRSMASHADDNAREAAIDALSRMSGHAADDLYIAALQSRGYQAVRSAARALRGSSRGPDVIAAAISAARRLREDSSETSRDARLALLERIGELATAAQATDVVDLSHDFDCEVARAAAAIAIRLGTATTPHCTPLPIELPPAAIALALGREVRLRVTLADESGGGSFAVRLRGDVAPIMAARVLSLAHTGWYDGLTWHRVEADFVVQGGGPGASEFIGHPRFIRDEVGGIAHPRGTIGMSTRGHDTGDAQWFFNLRDNARLVRDYTVFAEVVEGIEVVDGILEGDVIARIAEVPR